MISRYKLVGMVAVGVLVVSYVCPIQAQENAVSTNMYMTAWGEKVTFDNVWQEYPRPQLVREHWINLNGLWDYAIRSDVESQALGTRQDEIGQWDGKILVPFGIEAPLSGVRRPLEPTEALWYRRTVKLDPKAGQRIMLNFEAVDYQCSVSVNDKPVGTHSGGCTAFSFDITSAVNIGDNTILVRVYDATGRWQLNGKQTLKPRGIRYTRCSGIWQTVWLESVPDCYIERVNTTWDASSSSLTITPELGGDKSNGGVVRVTVSFNGKAVVSASGSECIKLAIPNPQLWSPTHPALYDLAVDLCDAAGNPVDRITSYAGLRTVGKIRDDEGNLRFALNGKPIFHWGPLDQGWWPDGLLTPPSDEAMRSDIEFLKAAGFNMIRKHIKVEPRRYYYHCDKIGMMVWQDQVSGGTNPRWTRLRPDPTDAEWPDDAHEQWVVEYRWMVDQLRNAPCIVVWVPFNERWGQHRTMEIGKMAVEYDFTRLVNIASGGNWWPVGDIADEHSYPYPKFPMEDNRFKDYIKVVGEFGGHGFPVEGHLWSASTKNWGYGGLPKDKEEWLQRYTKSTEDLAELKAKGLSGGVYTQTTDVEGEINGLLTYDRKVQKANAKVLADIHKVLGDLE